MQEKQLKIALLISTGITVILAAGFVVESLTGSENVEIQEAVQSSGIWMLCDNPDCEAAYEITVEEFREMVRAKGVMLGPNVMSQLAFTCKVCGQETAYRGMKCQKCGALFIMEEVPGDFSDRCPECGYSAIEEAIKEKREK
jgi:predicted Zn-ribbon and HTH transcriptional regulator